jgi:hypothetical protein
MNTGGLAERGAGAAAIETLAIGTAGEPNGPEPSAACWRNKAKKPNDSRRPISPQPSNRPSFV